MDKSISQKVIEKIKQEKISPKAKWKFLLCRCEVVFLLIFFILAGAVSLGIIINLFSQFEVGKIAGRPNGMRMLFFSLPFIWIIVGVFFSVLAITEFAKTRHGYKYKTGYVTGIFVLAIILLGGFFYLFGFSDETERYLKRYFSNYKQIVRTPEKVWSQPEEGLISGEIIEKDEVGEVVYVENWEEKIWEINYTKALVRNMAKIEIGEKVKIIGEKEGEYKFRAEEIRPWNGNQKK